MNKNKKLLCMILVFCSVFCLCFSSFASATAAYADPIITSTSGPNYPSSSGSSSTPSSSWPDNSSSPNEGQQGDASAAPHQAKHYSYTIDIFWELLDDRMYHAAEGETIIAEAEWRTSMPAYIFESIRDTGVKLEIRWAGGDTFTIDEVPEYDEKCLSFFFDEIIEMQGGKETEE